MAAEPNAILRRFDLSAWVGQKNAVSEDQLFGAFQRSARIQQQNLDILFAETCESIVDGYTWLQKVYQRTGRKTFLPAMRYVPEYHRLSPTEQEELHKRSAQVTHIYENWEEIVQNCVRPSMTHVEVQRLNLYQLSRASNDKWLDRFNNSQKPKIRRMIHRKYPRELINRLADHCDDLMTIIDKDSEQIPLIGRDLVAVLLKRLTVENNEQ